MTTAPERPYVAQLEQPSLPPRTTALAVTALAVAVGGTAFVHPLAPLAAAGAAIGVLLAWQRPVMAAVLVAAVCPALAGLHRGLGIPFFKLSEALLLLTAAVVLARRPLAGRGMRPADWGLLALAAAGAVFGAIHVVSGASPAPTFLRVGLQPTLLFLTWWTASRSVRSGSELRTVLRWVLLVSTVPAVLAVLQSANAPGVRGLLRELVAAPLVARPDHPGLIRVTGPFPIWHSLAAYLIPVIVVGVALLLRRDVKVLPVPVLLGVVVLDTAALTSTVTVTALLWATAAVFVVAAVQRRLGTAVLLVGILAAGGATVFAAPIAARVQAQVSTSASTSTEVPQTIAYRFSVWERDFLPLMERSVSYGVSNELPESVIFQNTENQYIALVLRGGVLMLLISVVSMTAIGLAVRRATRAPDPVVAVTASAALAVLLFLPVAAMVWPYLTNAGFPQSWLPIAGAVVGAAAARRT